MSLPTESQQAEAGSEHHDSAECARAWFALRTAHDRVAECLGADLSRECGLGLSDFEALLYLHHAEPARLRVGDLGEAVALSQPALSRLVARLEQRGLVARAKSGDDQRAVLVAVTDAGHDLLSRAMPLHAACVRDHFLGQVTEEEQATLLAILGRIR